ncbi:MAG: acyl-CoA thioesterase [Bacteroidota bacterium]
MIDYRPVADSKMEITELMVPAYANFGGKVHGGHILSLMNKIAYACASRHAHQYCITASVDTVDFKDPIEVGHLVRMYASVNFVANTSMEVGIRTESHNIQSGETKHTNTSYFTMVAMGEDGKPIPAPGLIINTRSELRRFLEGRARRTLKREYSLARTQLKTSFQIEEALKTLENAKCQVNWRP